jgi:hypothetical protein
VIQAENSPSPRAHIALGFSHNSLSEPVGRKEVSSAVMQWKEPHLLLIATRRDGMGALSPFSAASSCKISL